MRTVLNRRRSAFTLVVVLVGAAVGFWARRIPPPTAIVAPPPRFDNTGRFLSPYATAGGLAPWVVRGLAAKRASTAPTESTPSRVARGLLGNYWPRNAASIEARRVRALAWVGGENTMRATSDMSFNNVDDLIAYVYASQDGGHKEPWSEMVALVKAIYPDVDRRWTRAIRSARRRKYVRSNATSRASSVIAINARNRVVVSREFCSRVGMADLRRAQALLMEAIPPRR